MIYLINNLWRNSFVLWQTRVWRLSCPAPFDRSYYQECWYLSWISCCNREWLPINKALKFKKKKNHKYASGKTNSTLQISLPNRSVQSSNAMLQLDLTAEYYTYKIQKLYLYSRLYIFWGYYRTTQYKSGKIEIPYVGKRVWTDYLLLQVTRKSLPSTFLFFSFYSQ